MSEQAADPGDVERVARAMARHVEERHCADLDGNGTPGWALTGHASLDAWLDAHWRAYESQAMVAIEAMR